MDLHLAGRAGQTGQQGELLRLVHGVVRAGHHQPIPRAPAVRLLSQVQDAAVGQHVNGNVGLWANWGRTECKLEGHMANILTNS